MSMLLLAPNKTQAMTDDSVEISVRGKWIRVPALDVGGHKIIITGKCIKMAAVHDAAWLETELEDPEVYVKKLKELVSHGLRVDIFTFGQKLPNTLPKYSYPLEWSSVAAARTMSFKEWWEKLPQETRKNVRRSQKRGVVIAVKGLDDDLIRGIVGVNNDSPMRQGRPHDHYGKTFDQVKRDESSFLDRSDFIGAFFGDELIGFLKVVYRGEIASILNLLAKVSQQDKRPANALIAKAVELCAAKGVSYLTYGLFNYGNKRETSLREFKTRNRFEEILVPRYYVPLTTWGTLCIKARLHRELLAILPHDVIKIGLSAREKWYNLKQSMSRCSLMSEQPNRNRPMECSNPPAGSKSDPQ